MGVRQVNMRALKRKIGISVFLGLQIFCFQYCSSGFETISSRQGDLGFEIPSDPPASPPTPTPVMPRLLWPNEPAGFTLVTPQSSGFETDTLGSWTSGTRSGWGLKSLDATRSVSITSIADSILGESRTLRHSYPANHTGGGGVEPHFSLSGTYSRIYLGMYVRVSPNWVSHRDSGINKLAYIQANDLAFRSMWIEVTDYYGNGGLWPTLINQLGGFDGNGRYDSTTTEFTKGAWHLVEVVLEMRGNGERARYWLDGVLQIDQTGIGGPLASAGLTGVTFSGILGGIGPVGNPQAQFMEYDRIRIAVGN